MSLEHSGLRQRIKAEISVHSPEIEILLQSVRLNDQAAAAKAAGIIIRRSKVNWDHLLEVSRLHGIRPQLEDLLDRTGSPGIPDSVMERLGTANRENMLRQLRSITEFLQVRKSLKDHGVDVVPFKGFWLAEEMYGNIAARESFDVDLFIDIRDLGKIKSLMQERGYVIASLVTELKEEYILKELCEYNFGKFEDGACIFHFEYHWGSSRPVFRMNISLNDLRSQIISGEFQGNRLRVFSPAAHLLLAVMHHGGKEQYVQLKQVLDIAYIIQKHKDIDWHWLKAEAGRFGLEKVLCTGIRLATLITGVEVPAAVERGVESVSVRRLASGRMRMISNTRTGWGNFSFETKGWFFRIRSRDGLLLKIHFFHHYVRKVLIPWMVPRRFHYLFYNKEARINTKISHAV